VQGLPRRNLRANAHQKERRRQNELESTDAGVAVTYEEVKIMVSSIGVTRSWIRKYSVRADSTPHHGRVSHAVDSHGRPLPRSATVRTGERPRHLEYALGALHVPCAKLSRNRCTTIYMAITCGRKLQGRSTEHLLFLFSELAKVCLEGLGSLETHDRVCLRVKLVEELCDG
jgi:hypothetical protein